MATPRLAVLRLRGVDGGPLRVDVRSGGAPGERRPAVVICHGFKGFKDWGFFPRAAERLATAGFAAWSFNFSGSGVGEDGETFGELDRWARQTLTGDLADLATVVDRAVEEGAPWVGLLGHSRGGATALLQAARDARIRALVTWAAVDGFDRWPAEEIDRWRRDGTIDVVNLRTGQRLPLGLDLLDDLDRHRTGVLDIGAAASSLRIPWLIVHGSADESVPFAAGQALHRASRSAGSEFLEVAGAGHTFGVRHPWSGSTPEFDRVLERTVEFFAAALE
jgi:dienelactone hydrolase